MYDVGRMPHEEKENLSVCKAYGASEVQNLWSERAGGTPGSNHSSRGRRKEGEQGEESNPSKMPHSAPQQPRLYVCRHVCMHARMHECMYVGTYVCMDECMYPSKMPDRAP